MRGGEGREWEGRGGMGGGEARGGREGRDTCYAYSKDTTIFK